METDHITTAESPRTFPVDTFDSIGPLTARTQMLVKLAALSSLSDKQTIKRHATECLEMNITPSEIFHTIFSITDVIGLQKSLNALSIVQETIEE